MVPCILVHKCLNRKFVPSNSLLPSKSCLLSFHPSLGHSQSSWRQQNSKLSYSSLHPSWKVSCSLYAPNICICYILDLHSSLPHFVVICTSLAVCSIARACTICHCNSAEPQPQMFVRLSITPFKKVGVDCFCQVWVCP